MTHVMIDIETLATTPDAVITQIGLVIFDDSGPSPAGAHEWVISVASQPNRRIDNKTTAWHLEAPERVEQLRRSYTKEAISVRAALAKMFDLLASRSPDYIWAKSPSFDLEIIKNAAEGYVALNVPWEFWQERDVRTAFQFLELAGGTLDLKKTHRAIDDATEQAEGVARSLSIARLAGERSAAAQPIEDDLT